MTRRHPRGIFIPDLIVALVMATVLLMSMTAAVSALYRGERQMGAARAGARRLEANLVALQSGGKTDADVTVTRLTAGAPEGRVWVRVGLPSERHGPGQSLVGLVPAGGAP